MAVVSSTLLGFSTTSPIFLPLNPNSTHIRVPCTTFKTLTKPNFQPTTNPKSLIITAVSSNKSTTASITTQENALISIDSASDIVRNFYGGINARDLDLVKDLISENCVYEDLVFPQPFVGRKAILDFFKKFIDSFSKDLQFVIDDISNQDTLAIGVTWHLEWQGRPFPFSKGCSFYRLELVNGKKQIIYGRDSVEPAIKPGEAALVAIKGVTWLLQRFPQFANRL